MSNVKRGIILFLCAAVAAAGICLAGAERIVSAGDFDWSKLLEQKGSVTITYHDNELGEDIAGGAVAVYKAAHAISDEGYKFVYEDDFVSEKYPLPELKEDTDLDALNADLASRLKAIVDGNPDIKPLKEGEIGEEGVIKFEDLDVGLYLVVQTEPAFGYQLAKPFVFTVPIKEGDNFNFDVDAKAKPQQVSDVDTTECPVRIRKVILNEGKAVEKTIAEEDYFDFEFSRPANSNFPLPFNDQPDVPKGPVVKRPATDDDDSIVVRLTGKAGIVDIGTIYFTDMVKKGETKEYYYTVREITNKDGYYDKDGNKGYDNSQDYRYDGQVYWIKYTVGLSDDGSTLEVKGVEVRDTNAEGAVLPYNLENVPLFTNQYLLPDPSGNVTPTPSVPAPSTTPTPTNPPGNPPSGGGGDRLPQTGQLWWPVWLLCAAGVVMILSGAVVRRKKK